jgi:hypothetical protein
MSSTEVISKFVSFELMIKDSKHIVNLEQGATSTPEVQPVAFKATEEKKKESTPSRLPIDASKLDNEEIFLIIKRFRQILKQRKGKDYKPCSKRVCYRCGKSSHFLQNVHIQVTVTGTTTRKGRRRLKRKDTTTIRRVARRTWRGNGTLTRALPTPPTRTPPKSPSTKAFSSPNVGNKCLMDKDGKKKKVNSRDTPQIHTSDDEGSSSDDNDDLTSFFANFTKDQKKKINELIETINEKDDTLESQEDLLVKENKFFLLS